VTRKIVPAGRWVIITPPTKLDPELGRIVVDGSAPRREWGIVAVLVEGRTHNDCDDLREKGAARARRVYLDDPNSQNRGDLSGMELAQCERSDGSRHFMADSDAFLEQ
jgi:hypothetical protein